MQSVIACTLGAFLLVAAGAKATKWRGAAVTTALTAFLALAPAAFAEVQTYKADLKASSEVPANDSKGSGALTATYDTTSKKLTYSATYKDLTGPATMAHFHGPAAAGANAGVVVPVKEMTLTDAQAADLQAGKWYFNVHTAANKGGEIRGRVTK